MTETKLHKRKPGLKFTCEITCNSNGLPELVALSEVWGISWQLLDYQQSLTCKKCCKAQLKWTANINIVLDWNESLHTIVWSNISSGSLAVPHVPRAPSQSKQVRWGSEGLQLSCLFLTSPPNCADFDVTLIELLCRVTNMMWIKHLQMAVNNGHSFYQCFLKWP